MIWWARFLRIWWGGRFPPRVHINVLVTSTISQTVDRTVVGLGASRTVEAIAVSRTAEGAL